MLSVEKKYSKGEVIVKEGYSGNTFYVIQSGMVEVLKNRNNRELIVAVLGPNEFFGEMSLLDPNVKKRSATVRATEDTTVMIMGKEDFEAYLGTLAPGVRNLLNKLATRLREANEKVDAFSGKKLEPKDNDHIENFLTLDEIENARQHAVDVNFLSKKFRAGQIVLREGQSGQCGFIVKKGELEVSKMIDDRKVVLSRLGEHDIVGETALFNDVSRNANVVALTDGELMIFGKRDVINMTRQSPLELFMIMDSMSLKLERLNDAYCKSLIDLENSRTEVDRISAANNELKDKISRLENENRDLKHSESQPPDQAESSHTDQNT
jgi:CRP-like cAMP-binding protein